MVKLLLFPPFGVKIGTVGKYLLHSKYEKTKVDYYFVVLFINKNEHILDAPTS